MGNWGKRSILRERVESGTLKWRPLGEGEALPIHGGVHVPRPDSQRCRAVGLERGNCDQTRVEGEDYCYYHEKVRTEMLVPSAAVYPVWPLPEGGYVVLHDGQE